MGGMISDRNILDIFCTAFCESVEKHCKYAVVSGYVVISTGRTRGTEDIGMILERIDKDTFLSLHVDLLKEFDCIQPEDAPDLYDSYLKKSTAIRHIPRN